MWYWIGSAVCTVLAAAFGFSMWRQGDDPPLSRLEVALIFLISAAIGALWLLALVIGVILCVIYLFSAAALWSSRQNQKDPLS